jgi:hypothetical protein
VRQRLRRMNDDELRRWGCGCAVHVFALGQLWSAAQTEFCHPTEEAIAEWQRRYGPGTTLTRAPASGT